MYNIQLTVTNFFTYFISIELNKFKLNFFINAELVLNLGKLFFLCFVFFSKRRLGQVLCQSLDLL